VSLASPPPHLVQRRESDRDRRTRELFCDIGASAPGEARRELLNEIVMLHADVARSVAARYANRGVPVEDLRQVAYEGLVKAVHRFDPTLGHDFLGYAVPTLRGEIQHYFRDHGWAVRPPRGVQETLLRLGPAVDAVAQQRGHEPALGELAGELDLTVREVDRALVARAAGHVASLDRPAGDDDTGPTLAQRVPAAGGDVEAAEARLLLAPLVRRLGSRDQRVLYLRFCCGLSQQEIGEDIGVTQMQVSRILTRILAALRADIEDPAGPVDESRSA